jgi:hypothetical protein
MASRQEGCTQNLQHCVGHHEVQGFDCARISFALFSAANLAPLRTNIRGFSAVTPPAAARFSRHSRALLSHFRPFCINHSPDQACLQAARPLGHASRITHHSWL